MVKIEQLNDAAKAVFIRGGIEQPVFLNAILTDREFETFKVSTGSVVVSINESEVRTIVAEPATIAASFTDSVAIEVTDVDTNIELADTPTIVSETVEVPETVDTPEIVWPAPRARK